MLIRGWTRSMMHGCPLAWPQLALGLDLAGTWPGPWLALGLALGWPANLLPLAHCVLSSLQLSRALSYNTERLTLNT